MEPAVHHDTEKQLIKVLPAQAGPTHAEQPSIPAFATEQQTMQILPAQVGLNQAEHFSVQSHKDFLIIRRFFPLCISTSQAGGLLFQRRG